MAADKDLEVIACTTFGECSMANQPHRPGYRAIREPLKDYYLSFPLIYITRKTAACVNYPTLKILNPPPLLRIASKAKAWASTYEPITGPMGEKETDARRAKIS